MFPAQIAASKQNEKWARGWVGGKVHWMNRRQLNTMCDKDLRAKGLNLPAAMTPKEQVCEKCERLAAKMRREYARKAAKGLQMTFAFDEEGAK